jgi:two-component system, sensor histidine kinase and response regulator
MGFAGSVSKPVKQGELGACLASALGYGPAPMRPAERPQSTCNLELRAELQLLLVEDNKINQEVALGILENLGYRADVVGDGQSALAALGAKEYDLVLMDCQLPGMDGYEASRLIREPDTPVLNHDIPIIATTANAMAGDREKCLAAGMNDYVAKPIKPDALERAIEEWTGGMPANVAHRSAQPEPAVAPTNALFDAEDFLERLMGNQALAQRIIRGFVEETPGQIALLAQAINKYDTDQVRLIAHSIKGAAGNACGLEVREAAWKLEQKGTAGNLTGAATVMVELNASFERVKPVMQAFSEGS